LLENADADDDDDDDDDDDNDDNDNDDVLSVLESANSTRIKCLPTMTATHPVTVSSLSTAPGIA
jgi:hypothetical protein